jgi:hypothetical protein
MAQTKAKVIKSLVIALLITSINSTNTYAAGRTNGSIANTVLSGSGVPSTKVGIDGDFYIDTKSLNFYGPKINSKWPIPVSLKGPAGPIGPSGVDGKNGTAGSSSASIGAPGPAGATGPAGPQGATGATGAQGATGPQGPAGSGGGGAGPAGPKGETGTAGVVGPSNLYTGAISFSGVLAGDIGASKNSVTFGSFENGKQYVVDVYIRGSSADTQVFPLSLSVAASTGSASITTSYVSLEGHSYRSNIDTAEHSLIGKVIVDGTSAGSNFGLVATITCGVRTSNPATNLTFTGEFVALLVGAIN